jgi:hypothetical protein
MELADAHFDKNDNSFQDVLQGAMMRVVELDDRMPALLNQLQQGLLWAQHGGRVRHANAQAMCLTGLRAGDRLPPGELLRAVVESVHHRMPRHSRLLGQPAAPGDLVPQLLCTVLPGLADDDALIVLGSPQHLPPLDTSLLMRLIADDLAPPVQRAQRALSIARECGDEHGTAALLDELDGLLSALAGVAGLARSWDDAAALQDRLEPLTLLREAWAEVDTAARARSVRLRLSIHGGSGATAPVYGDADALRRVLRLCLQAAIQATVPGAVLQVEARQVGPRVHLVFVDCPMFDGLPLRASSPAHRAVPQRAQAQVDWHLCRRLLAQQGGQMRDEQDGGARNFMIDLPAGAPFPADNPAMDMAQAHRYARDLAALMARSRRGTEPAAVAGPSASSAGARASLNGGRVVATE